MSNCAVLNSFFWGFLGQVPFQFVEAGKWEKFASYIKKLIFGGKERPHSRITWQLSS